MIKTIGETAFSHQGDFNYLLKQIDEAAKGECDYIKFQILVCQDEYFVHTHPGTNTIDELTFSKEQWIEALKYSNAKGLKVLALPLTIGCIKFCEENQNLIDLYEVHSVTFNEIPFLNELAKTKKKIVLGVGGRDLTEIDIAKKALNRDHKELILMFGFQSFPTAKENLNLNKIKNLKQYYNCELGYADHSENTNDDYTLLNAISQSLGCTFFEKHIIVDKKEERIDGVTAIASDEFISMRKNLILNSTTLGNGDLFSLNEKEQTYKQREKKIVANRDIEKSKTIEAKDLAYKVTQNESDFQQVDYLKILQKRATRTIKKGETINFKDIIS
ncbi:MAG: N,N'-diacetyllegionaminate synthase [Planctomycetota bacterium]|jgi:N,N'-diacetyllegionaminate synthase